MIGVDKLVLETKFKRLIDDIDFIITNISEGSPSGANICWLNDLACEIEDIWTYINNDTEEEK